MEILKEDIDLVRLALSVYHTRTVYPGCVEAFERILQEQEMRTPMAIEMEADVDIAKIICDVHDRCHTICVYNYRDVAIYQEKAIRAALLTKTPENVTCENLSNADERQKALDALKRYSARMARYKDYAPTDYSHDVDGLADYIVIAEFIERAALQSPWVPVIPYLEHALAEFDEDGEIDRHNEDAIVAAARAYAELQKGV